MNRIFLIGYMGCGKTTVGKQLAEKLGYRFIDMDQHLEERQFKSVSQIFAEQGEDEFRKLEQKCLHEVAEFEDTIISTGGGAPCFFDNIEHMNSRGLTVYLKMTAEELAVRLESLKQNTRPLIAGKKGDELRDFIANGIAKREAFYNRASIVVNANNETVADEIINCFDK